MYVLQLQPQRPWWRHQQTHLSLTESMFLVASPTEMWSPPPPPHPWQIFSCSWRSTHLQWVKPVCLWWTTSCEHIIKWSESGVTFNVQDFVSFGKITSPASQGCNAAKCDPIPSKCSASFIDNDMYPDILYLKLKWMHH